MLLSDQLQTARGPWIASQRVHVHVVDTFPTSKAGSDSRFAVGDWLPSRNPLTLSAKTREGSRPTITGRSSHQHRLPSQRSVFCPRSLLSASPRRGQERVCEQKHALPSSRITRMPFSPTDDQEARRQPELVPAPADNFLIMLQGILGGLSCPSTGTIQTTTVQTHITPPSTPGSKNLTPLLRRSVPQKLQAA